MPALPSHRRRSGDVYESQERWAASSKADSQEPSIRKRDRLTNEPSLNSPLIGTSLAEGAHAHPDVLQRGALQTRASPRAYRPGSIVRVKLTNFVTFTAAEIFPGPSLNMLIGPNGTGKSTLVCAICLGLGWGTQHLGRAKDVSEYVKHGSQESVIEIELAKDGKKFKSNVVITCTIKREGNKTAFSVNGKAQSRKAVVDLARSLSIQIDNLCQFLPQDKVVEFAAMTPIELLRSTQRAVASQEMVDMHEELKHLRRKQKDLQARVTADQDTLSNLESRQQLQEADVERFREREQVAKRVEMLELARPTVQYRQAQQRWKLAKARANAVRDELATLRREVEPSLRDLKAKQRYQQQIDVVVKERKDALAKCTEYADKVDRQFQALHDENTEVEQAITAEKEMSSKYKKEVIRVEAMVRDQQIQLKHAPPEFDTAAYNEQMRAKQRLWEEAELQIRDAQEQQRSLTRQGREKKQRIQQAEESLSQLDSQAGKQAIKLRKLSDDSWRLWQWVQQHPDQFEKHVFGPPIVECSMKDPRYVDLIEAIFKRTLLLSFTVQTRNDFQKLSSIAHDLLGLSDVNTKTMPVGLDLFSAPVAPENMRRYGFEGWALDYINGPEPVLAMLCAEVRIHETGVSMCKTSPKQFEMLEDSPICAWVTERSAYRLIRRREYGPGAVSTQVRAIRPASVWIDQPVDLTARRELQETIGSLQEEIRSSELEIRVIQDRIEISRKAWETNRLEGKSLGDEKAAKQKALLEFKALPTKIAGNEAKLRTIREHLTSTMERQKEHAAKQYSIAMNRALIALKYADAVESLRVAHNSLYEAQIMSIEAASDLSILAERNRSVRDLLASKEKEVKEVVRDIETLNAIASKFLEEVQDIMRRIDGTTQEFFKSLPAEQTLEEFDSEIASEKARLELMHEGNGNTIREFELRKRKIEKLTTNLSEMRAGLADLDTGIDALRNKWEPELDRLVKNISDSFSFNMEQISCAGEVGIWKDEDFDQWAIQIRVKFRENEPLVTLTSHRQSGGERAVSTIFYLMSLQSLTASPFRVVDEINQGMDPRNERLVHKRMVDIACGATADALAATVDGDTADEDDDAKGGSQYFLITPKLLHDLSYARGMKVLCIASGEYMPEDRTRVDFRSCVNRMKGLRFEKNEMGVAAG
ncbi:MAG: hypothetical protein Q9163_005158 [Psora crenata]